MIPDSLRHLLDEQHARYRVISHEPVFTARQTARVVHVPVQCFAKPVLLDVYDGWPDSHALVVLPANARVQLDALGRMIGYPIDLATEEAFARVFPACERGAAPPLSELANEVLPLYVDARLAPAGTIAFNAGTHTDLVVMSWHEYARIASPRIIDVS